MVENRYIQNIRNIRKIDMYNTPVIVVIWSGRSGTNVTHIIKLATAGRQEAGDILANHE